MSQLADAVNAIRERQERIMKEAFSGGAPVPERYVKDFWFYAGLEEALQMMLNIGDRDVD